MKLINDLEATTDSPVDILFEDSASPLNKLLKESNPKPREIDRVAAHLSEIMEARQRKITWNAIAEALQMNRCTLINAVKTLTAPPTDKRRPGPGLTQRLATVSPRHAVAPETNAFLPQQAGRGSPLQQAPPSPAHEETRLIPSSGSVGITPLGRARIEKFNL